MAGTDPNDPQSKFELVSVVADGATGPIVQWSSISGCAYNLWSSTNLLTPGSWSPIADNLAATPPVNTFTAAAPVSAQQMFAVEAQLP